jgi:hypothetical protein
MALLLIPKPLAQGPAGYTLCASEGRSYTLATKSDTAYRADEQFNLRFFLKGGIQWKK